MIFTPNGFKHAFPINCECPCHEEGEVCLSCVAVMCGGAKALDVLVRA